MGVFYFARGGYRWALNINVVVRGFVTFKRVEFCGVVISAVSKLVDFSEG